jgi:hypothetical protein
MASRADVTESVGFFRPSMRALSALDDAPHDAPHTTARAIVRARGRDA